MLHQFLEVVNNHLYVMMMYHPSIFIGLSLTGCSIVMLLLFTVPWGLFKKNEINLLHDKLDILIHEYKVEVTRAIEEEKIKQIL